MTPLTEHRIRMVYLIGFVWGPRRILDKLLKKFSERNKYFNKKVKYEKEELQLRLF